MVSPMATPNNSSRRRNGVVVLARIAEAIHRLRGERVMLDADLARLYGVPTKALIQAVKRNAERFPSDFTFQLSTQELAALRSQIVTSKLGRGGRRTSPYAFTEQGVAMLSSVLRSARAVQVNVEIMRVFVRMRKMLSTHRELARRVDQLERKLGQHDEEIATIFQAIKQLMIAPTKASKRIGF